VDIVKKQPPTSPAQNVYVFVKSKVKSNKSNLSNLLAESADRAFNATANLIYQTTAAAIAPPM
jgi:hypothetical protein